MKITNQKILEISHLSHGFTGKGAEDIMLFDDINFSLSSGDTVALLGSSGSGKSSLLHVLGLMAQQQKGEIKFYGQSTKQLSLSAKNRLRGQTIGFVFQHHYLLDELTALENIILPLRILGIRKKIRLEQAKKILDQIGLTKRANHYPSQLSGGERQRVALGRALVHEPSLLIADEPTGNLDPHNADLVFALMLAEIKKRGMAALIATHDWERAKKCKKRLMIKNKKLVMM